MALYVNFLQRCNSKFEIRCVGCEVIGVTSTWVWLAFTSNAGFAVEAILGKSDFEQAGNEMFKKERHEMRPDLGKFHRQGV